MQSTDEVVAAFSGEAYWTGDAVELSFDLRGSGSTNTIRCRVPEQILVAPEEVLRGSVLEGRSLDEREMIRLCERFEDRIKNILVAKFIAGDLDADGSVTIRPPDLTSQRS